MIYEGKAITVQILDGGIAELRFDLQGESVNKFNQATLAELKAAVDKIQSDSSIKGVIVTSGKDVFIVGADITEFVQAFQLPEEELVAGSLETNRIFNAFEDLNVPTVAAINGLALGGGLEMCLACDFRVMAQSTGKSKNGQAHGYTSSNRIERSAYYTETAPTGSPHLRRTGRSGPDILLRCFFAERFITRRTQ